MSNQREGLYRLYDEDDTLLYVGRGRNPEARWQYHAVEKEWWEDVHRKTVEWFDTHEQAATAEGVAVRVENPAYNLTFPAEDGSLRWQPRQPLPRPIKNPRKKPAVKTRVFGASDELWEAFSRAVEASPDPEADRSKVLRQFLRWYVGLPGARLPVRPADAKMHERPAPDEGRASDAAGS